jgi:hypothetical protein
MSQQSLERELTVSQILRTCRQKFTQIKEKYFDGHSGRCAIGVIMSYHGCDGKESALQLSELLAALFALRHARIGADLIIDLNDSKCTDWI